MTGEGRRELTTSLSFARKGRKAEKAMAAKGMSEHATWTQPVEDAVFNEEKGKRE